jgi:UDP:flavonoid glycosyltransferase YjiC (YdhE family)
MGAATVMGQTMRVVAIAKELQRRGHEIKFLAGDKLVSVIKGYGFDVIEFVNMPQMGSFLRDKSAEKSNQQEERMQEMQEIMDKIRTMELEVGKKEQPDIMLCGTLTGVQAAKELGIPSVFACLQPHGKKTLEMFSKGLQENDPLKTYFREVLEAASLILIEGIPELGYEADLANNMEWTSLSKEKIRFTGPLLIDDPEKMPEQEALKLRHIGEGHTKMVYVTIGGGSKLIGEQFLRVVLEAFRLLPMVKGVISAGLDIPSEEFSTFNPPKYVSIYEFVPGTEMIKASDVTVFHGGSSTLMTCLACGKPAVVIPSMGEQEDNAAVLGDHGAGIVLEKETLTAIMLAQAIEQILQDGSYQKKAEDLRALCRVYGGATAAASMIENVVRSEVLHV